MSTALIRSCVETVPVKEKERIKVVILERQLVLFTNEPTDRWVQSIHLAKAQGCYLLAGNQEA